MGLDQRFDWIGKISDDVAELIKNKNISKNDILLNLGVCYVEDCNDKKYQHIKKYLTPIDIRETITDWDKVEEELGINDGNHMLCGLSQYTLTYKNEETGEKADYQINIYSDKYHKEIENTLYFYHKIKLMALKNAYDVQKLFDTKYPDSWDVYDKKYEIIYAGYYPVEGLSDDISKLTRKYSTIHDVYGDNNVFYSADW